MTRTLFLLLGLSIAAALITSTASASVLASIRAVVHDSQHRPIPGATVTLKSANSAFSKTVKSDSNGAVDLSAVPLGSYVVTVSAPNFDTLQQEITVESSTSPVFHFQLEVAAAHESVTVSAQENAVNTESATPTTLISREAIARTPGADRTNSLAMITDYVPGAYMTHDMLHLRGGHQVGWLIDGVMIPNTNIASNIGPQIDPKDIDYLEVQRGSYNADLGDRTYGIFNVVPRSGFERDREGELVLSAGNYGQTNDQISFGNHSEKFAWFLSANGNRSSYGLMPPIEQPVHNAENGYGGFASLIYNNNAANQYRVVMQLRRDYYQIPYDPDPDSWQNQLYNSSGLRDGQHETDGYATLTWAHNFNAATLLQVSPFYHFNSAQYEPKPIDLPTATTSGQTGNYGGVQSSITATLGKHALSGGLYGYGQHENDVFGVVFNDGSFDNFSQRQVAGGGVQESFFGDTYRVTPWITLIGGMRQTHFQGDVTEDAFYPRLGATARIPKLNWVFRAFYGHFYQPPPLTSVSGPLLQYANGSNTTFVPLRGERDEEHQFGVEIPYRGWRLDADTFVTRASNFLDHSNIGESSIFIPVTVEGALIQGWELTLNSPQLWNRGRFHLAYSNQLAQQRGPVTGGLVCYPPNSSDCVVDPGYSALDHDQRNTLNVGFNGNLPYHMYGSFNVYYGSGFANGETDPPSPYSGDYLPAHTTADLAVGKTIRDRWTVSVNFLNVANTRVLLDNSLTFGGFHYNDPRQIYGEVRYRFHF